MDVFDLRSRLVEDYAKYTRSFIKIRDPRIDAKVASALDGGALWPEPLLQLNPTFKPGGTIDDLVKDGTLHRECSKIFRVDKTDADLRGKDLLLHEHQTQAIRKSKEGKSYILTSGTGSGKSLTYIVPIVDHVLRNGSGQGIQAIVVYPMNALANSQEEELAKFIRKGYVDGQAPVQFARYTGQEKGQEREAIRQNPPDILLTNYMMLELLLTRIEDRMLVKAAQGLKFLVFDELHTYRGRQGADVALLIRRCREAFGGHDVTCIGTSATMSSEGNSNDQKTAVADVATMFFGTKFDASQVIGETLQRATPELNFRDQANRALLAGAVTADAEPPDSYEVFRQNPLASWIETIFGVVAEEETGRLIRQKPQRLRGSGSAAEELAEATGLTPEICYDVLRRFLTKGSKLFPTESSRFPIFAFRLHQFLTRGDTVWATIESEADRHLELGKMVSKPGAPDQPLFPLVFCRQCGEAYFRAMLMNANGQRYLEPREDRREDKEDGQTAVYVHVSQENPWPAGDDAALLDRVPGLLKETTADGIERVRKDEKNSLPEVVRIDATGKVVAGQSGVHAAVIKNNFLFCLNPACKVMYGKQQKSERGKLGTLGVDNRSTATTVLAVQALIELQRDRDLKPEARKLLSFTDNRQDASLQAGHFNDFVQVSLLRSALFKACEAKGAAGIRHGELSRGVFEQMGLKPDDYAADPEVRGPALSATQDALRRVINYFLYRDLQRGWRITAPNLEECGLLRFDYEGLDGDDGLLNEAEVWSRGIKSRVERDEQFVATPDALSLCPPDRRDEILRTMLDVLRRNLAIKVDVLDPAGRQDLIDQTINRLLDTSPWYLDEPSEMVSSQVAYPRARQGERESGYFISSYGSFGRYVRRQLLPFVDKSAAFGRPEVDSVIKYLFLLLKRYGIVEQVRGGDVPGYQINPDAIRWIADDGEVRQIDRTRLLDAGETPPDVNRYFTNCYREFVGLKAKLEAREHTAQVTSEERQDREDSFRSGRLPLLFCSPTMELGVDISQLNVVNLRNVPPTPANYAQRSGRAGRGGQPALVYTYCAGRSPHDQYYFREPDLMVAGSVTPPRIDLRNRDLVQSHIHAVYMEVARPDLGKTLTTVLEIQNDDGKIHLPVKDSISAEFRNPVHRAKAAEKAAHLIDSIRTEVSKAAWFHDNWVSEVLDRIELTFDASCERWRSLYRSAFRQREIHHRIIADQSRPEADRNHSRRLRAQAESQIKLLTEAAGIYEGDFYSYRYFAAEGFLPGYNFPRLPLSAYVPARGRRSGKDEFVSRPRFLAISEFGPRALIYHEGARYRVYKVNLDFKSDDIDQARDIASSVMKRCLVCGYAHLQEGLNLKEVCEHCGAALEPPSVIPDLVQLQNVSLKLAQRITCDEEERQRFGYDIRTSYRFPETGGKLDRRDAEVVVDGNLVMRLSYGDATSLYRINMGWQGRKRGDANGFLLDVERGYWARNQQDDSDSTDGPQGNVKRVVPFVSDTKNALVMRFEPARSEGEMASLQAAFKEAIQEHFQLEPRELSVEPMPAMKDRRELLFYESSEGGAGVLRQLVEDPTVISRLAKRAIALCHFDPETLEEDDPSVCGKACYKCLLDYGNQRDHLLMDRHAILPILSELRDAETRAAGGAGSRSDRMAELRKVCDSGLEKKWLDLVDDLLLVPPSHAQLRLELYFTRPDFFYSDHNTAIYVDGPVHDEAEQMRNDEAINLRLKRAGYVVVRFHYKDDWRAIFKKHPDIFGVPRE